MKIKQIKHLKLIKKDVFINLGLGSYTQAQEYLSQAEWTVLKNPECPLMILSKLHRNIAMLQMSQENYDKALRNLSNDVRPHFFLNSP